MKYCKSVDSDALLPLPESLAFCATVNEAGDEQLVTDMMVRRACELVDDSQMWPYAAAENYAAEPTVTQTAAAFSTAVIIPFPSSRTRK